MAKVKYADIVPIGNALIIAGTFFFLGLVMGNLPYDFKTLYSRTVTEEDFLNSLRHYKTWAEIPSIPLHILHLFIGIGFVGFLIKIYRPSDDAKYFEYTSLFLYVVSVCVYLTNLKTGVESCLHGNWGEVDQNTGINVIAASEVLIVFLLGGILVLQAGLYYGEWEYQQRLAEFHAKEAEEAEEATEKEESIKETKKDIKKDSKTDAKKDPKKETTKESKAKTTATPSKQTKKRA